MSVARAHRRRSFGLLSAGAALSALALSPVLTGTAHAGSLPAPAFASVSATTGDAVASPVVGGPKPTVITKVGASVKVTVSLWTSPAKTTAAAFNKDTDFTLTTGGVSVTRTFPANTASKEFTTDPFGAAVNQTKVSVSFPGLKGKSAISAASSPTEFDVLLFVEGDTAKPADGPYTRTVGNDGAACGELDAEHPFCATVLLPKGAGNGGNIAVGTGVCDDAKTTYSNCKIAQNSFVIELLADLTGVGYQTTEPATLILSCDKIYCGNGAIKNNVPHLTSLGNGPIANVPACSAKGVAPAPVSLIDACVDYVQSTRDNAGDTHLYVLFTRDLRGSCC
ncbi:MAG: hypothetical protein QOD68_3063 [Actinomycetota bacterium]|nr:hypothetical protein [Actinomycetota bacterium]